MPEHGNRSAIAAETLYQVRRKPVRALAQFAVRQSSVAAKVCDRLDSLEALIHKGRRAEIATAIHRDQNQNDSEVIKNQQHAMHRGMSLEPAHMRIRC